MYRLTVQNLLIHILLGNYIVHKNRLELEHIIAFDTSCTNLSTDLMSRHVINYDQLRLCNQNKKLLIPVTVIKAQPREFVWLSYCAMFL